MTSEPDTPPIDTPPDPDGGKPPAAIDTGGGAYVGGDVDTRGGDFVGRDKIVITEEGAYDVRGLPNPYLGLRSYTYEDKAAYAGREQMVAETVERITDPQARQTLTFITGASGSGKSSFAQAGLLPALEAFYQARHKTVQRAVFRPSSSPLALLGDALAQLGLPEPAPSELSGFTPQQFAGFLTEHTPPDQVNLLVIDQFEELFTQSPLDQAGKVFAFLAGWPEFQAARTHALATLRSDYLDELFDDKPLWDIAVQRGVELRAMSPAEVRVAIPGPLQAKCKQDQSYCQKRFEPALLEQMAQDAAGEATYLPLLQVSLQELWNGGSLILGRYHGLADAIRQRAEKVYAYQDYDASQPSKERPAGERMTILEVLIDLVVISLDDDPRRDVRVRRSKADLAKGSAERARLIDDLIEARLLSAGVERVADRQIDVVDIIHEALINQWDRLRTAVTERREELRRRTRFEQELRAWLQNDRKDEYLLSGVHLKEARSLKQSGDIALSGEPAQEFLQRSIRSNLSQQQSTILQRSALQGAAGGALGFCLAYLITNYNQVFDRILFPLLVAVRLIPGLIAGVLVLLGVVIPAVRYPNLSRWKAWLVSGLIGAAAMALAMVINAFFNSISDRVFLFWIAVEGALWGFACGATMAWALRGRRPWWQVLLGVGIVSGLALLVGESFAHGFLRPRGGEPVATLAPAAWQLFLAGAVFPLCVILATRLGKGKEALDAIYAR